MDTSLAEDVQQAAKTLASDQFFFMSPFRSFTTSGCFARISEPAVVDSPDSAFQQKLAQAFADAKTRGIANPVMVGPSRLIPPSRLNCLFPQLADLSRPSKQRSSRYFSGHDMPDVTRRTEIPPQDVFMDMVARGPR
jgi:isochorismate synthase